MAQGGITLGRGLTIDDLMRDGISRIIRANSGSKFLKSLLGMLPAGPTALDTWSEDRDLSVSLSKTVRNLYGTDNGGIP